MIVHLVLTTENSSIKKVFLFSFSLSKYRIFTCFIIFVNDFFYDL